MSGLVGNPFLLASAAGGATGYQIERSLRFNISDSAYLSRTPSSAGNRKTWTWSGWVKRSSLSSPQTLFGASTSGVSCSIAFSNSIGDALEVWDGVSGAYRVTTQLFRDLSAWYHIVVVLNTPDATANNRIRIYVNGVEVTSFSTIANPAQNADLGINATIAHALGADYVSSGPRFYSNGYLADIHFIDGQALTPSSFTEVSATTGQLIPKAYTGTFGTNGFWLKFSDNSAATATTLGKDYSGNGNNWTPNNLSVTAGAGNDSLTDTPTSYGTDTGAGGEVRGNYATLNPLALGSGTPSNGNLDFAGGTGAWGTRFSSIGVSSGKWYFEATLLTNSNQGFMCGVSRSFATGYLGASADQYSYYSAGGLKYNNSVSAAYGASYNSNGTIVGAALDLDAGTITFYKDGVSQGVAYSSLPSGVYYFGISCFDTQTGCVNFGQRPFAYTAPSGFKALCDTNLPAPVVAKPNSVFDVALWTGNGSARSITGLNFNPDFVWIKGRSGATDHALYDVVRGTEKRLESNTADAEVTSDGGVTAFNGDGFSLGTLAQVNTNSSTYVGWAWDGGTSTVTNTQGSITSQVRANASAGFSIATLTQPSSGSFSVGHGLGVAPSFYIYKVRGVANNWGVWHQSLTGGTYYLLLNTTGAQVNDSGVWPSSPTSSVVNLGSKWTGAGAVGAVLYSFAPVAGYSSFGSYTGNGSADGPFVYLGFRPAVLLVKMSSTGNWTILDDKREGYNVDNDPLYPNLASAEGSTDLIDITSNGFKVRTTDASFNTSAGTYIYAAWASSPFAYSRAR